MNSKVGKIAGLVGALAMVLLLGLMAVKRQPRYYYGVRIQNVGKSDINVEEWHIHEGPNGRVPEQMVGGGFEKGVGPYMQAPGGVAHIRWKAVDSGLFGETNIVLNPPSGFAAGNATDINFEINSTNGLVRIKYVF